MFEKSLWRGCRKSFMSFELARRVCAVIGRWVNVKILKKILSDSNDMEKRRRRTWLGTSLYGRITWISEESHRVSSNRNCCWSSSNRTTPTIVGPSNSAHVYACNSFNCLFHLHKINTEQKAAAWGSFLGKVGNFSCSASGRETALRNQIKIQKDEQDERRQMMKWKRKWKL